MPIQIEANSHDFSEPVALLSDCHRRIEMFLRVLEAVASTIDRPPSNETVRSLETALRYFREAAPKHTADEEESLFPRLRGMQSFDAKAALAKLKRLEEEHQRAAFLHSEVEKLGRRYLANRTLTHAEVCRYREAVADLQSLYQRHIQMEDSLVFPLATSLLSRADKKEIGSEMATQASSARHNRQILQMSQWNNSPLKMPTKWMPVIDPEQCSGCGLCVGSCGPQSLAKVDDIAVLLIPDTCGSEEHCISVCPDDAIHMAWIPFSGTKAIGRWSG